MKVKDVHEQERMLQDEAGKEEKICRRQREQIIKGQTEKWLLKGFFAAAKNVSCVSIS